MRGLLLLLSAAFAANEEQREVLEKAVARLDAARKGHAEAVRRHAELDAKARERFAKALETLRSDSPPFSAFESGMEVVRRLLAEMRGIDALQASEESLHRRLTAAIAEAAPLLWRHAGVPGRKPLLEEADAALERIEKARVDEKRAERVAEALEAAVASPLFDAQVEIVRAVTLGLRDLTALDASDREGADEARADLRFRLRDAAFALMHDGCDLIEAWRRQG